MKVRIAACALFLAGAVRTFSYTGCAGDTAVATEYIFHEGGGSTAYNTGTGDGAGDAALTNRVTFSADVPPANTNCGYSASIPGTGSSTNTAALETGTNYQPLAGATNFTIMAWVKRESASTASNQSARIVSDTSSLTLTNTTVGFEFRFSGASGTLALRINGNEVSTTAGGIAPNSNKWHHVAVVFDASRPGTNVNFYIDGIQRGTGNSLTNIPNSNSSRLTIGNSSVGRNIDNVLVGKIDDVRILRGFSPDVAGNNKTNAIIRCYMNRADDFVLPTITCPPSVTATSDAGSSYASHVNLGQPVTSDNCALANVMSNAPAAFPVGVSTVNWVATDLAGNTNSCAQLVMVTDSGILDNDDDGLSNADELSRGTNPNNRDSDGDGYNDGQEVHFGTDPLSAASHPSFASNLQGWWKLDEGSGMLASDSSGNGNTGSLSSGAKWTAGVLARALCLTNAAQSVTISNRPSLDTPTKTVTCWVRFPAHFLGSSLLGNESVDGAGFSVSIAHNHLLKNRAPYPYEVHFRAYDATGTAATGVFGFFRLNIWYSLAMVMDGSNIVSYVNGHLMGSTPCMGYRPSSSPSLFLGSITGVRSNAAVYLDDVRIFDRALSSVEIAILYSTLSTLITVDSSVCANSTGNPASVEEQAVGSVYSWAIVNGTIESGQGTKEITWTAGSGGDTIVRVTAVDPEGRISVGSKAVTVVSPIAVITAPDRVCPMADDKLATVPDAGAGASYVWAISNGTISSGQGTHTISWFAGSTGPVELNVTVAKSGCVVTGSQSVFVGPPSCTITGNPDICLGGSSVYAVHSEPGFSYQWSVTSASAYIDGAANSTNVLVRQSCDGNCPMDTFDLTLIVNDADGCQGSCVFSGVITSSVSTVSIACPTTQTAQIGTNCQAALPDLRPLAQVTGGCGTIQVTQSPAPGTPISGTIFVNLTALDSQSHSSSCDLEVLAQGSVAPLIQCPADVTLNGDETCQAEIPDLTGGASIATNCGNLRITQSPPAHTQVEDGLHPVTITAADDFGNTGNCTVNVIVLCWNKDSDGDGLTDYDEVYVYGTDPFNPNTDGDCMSDGYEVQNGFDPLDPSDGQSDADADGDGFSNCDEYQGGSDPNSSNSTPPSTNPNDPVKSLLADFNFTHVNLLESFSGLSKTTWHFNLNDADRILEIRAALGRLLPHFLDLHINANGSLANTNVVVVWNLSSILSNVYGTATSSWQTGSPSVGQVQELIAVLAGLTYIVKDPTYKGVPGHRVNLSGGNQPYHSIPVNDPYPANWPADLDKYQHLLFEQNGGYGNSIVDDFFIFNGTVRVPTSGYLTTGNTHEVTSAWNNNGNTLVLWDCGDCAGNTDEVYLSPFDVVHIMHVPQTRIRARTGQINNGFDPTGLEAWASVAVGETRDQLEISVEPANQADKLELKIVTGAAFVDITPKTFSGGVTTLSLVGKASGEAVIEVRVKNTSVVANKLHVMVRNWQTVPIAIYRVTDNTSTLTSPVTNAPSDQQIVDVINESFLQACVTAVVATATSPTMVNYDILKCDTNLSLTLGKDGAFQIDENPRFDGSWSGKKQIFLLRNSGVPYGAGSCGGLMARGVTRTLGDERCFVFTQDCIDTGSSIEGLAAHEFGHTLNLSQAPIPLMSTPNHDAGPFPNGTCGLMRKGDPAGATRQPVPCGKWLRHEDWDAANFAASRL